MQIDKTWSDDFAGSVNSPDHAFIQIILGERRIADKYNFVANDYDIGCDCSISRAVENVAVFDQEIYCLELWQKGFRCWLTTRG